MLFRGSLWWRGGCIDQIFVSGSASIDLKINFLISDGTIYLV
jgi:hypothetical protein